MSEGSAQPIERLFTAVVNGVADSRTGFGLSLGSKISMIGRTLGHYQIVSNPAPAEWVFDR